MNEQINVIQCPKYLNREDLPETIEENTPFAVKEQNYILVKENFSSFEVCEEIDGLGMTTKPEDAKSYFIIKKI